MIFKDIHKGEIEINLEDVSCCIVDIDGTIADNSHRTVWLKTKPKNWNAYNKPMSQDKPITEIIKKVQEMYVLGIDIVFCSGREEIYRNVTREWIDIHTELRKSPLYMRSKKDYRKDSIVKEELCSQIIRDGYEPTLVLDDRNQVVDMWRELGLTCIQVAEGDF